MMTQFTCVRLQGNVGLLGFKEHEGAILMPKEEETTVLRRMQRELYCSGRVEGGNSAGWLGQTTVTSNWPDAQ